MITTHCLFDHDKIINAPVHSINKISELQIGKTYLIIHTGTSDFDNRCKEPLKFSNGQYKAVKIISIVPRLNYDKIAKAINYDTMPSHGSCGHVCFDDEDQASWSFREFLTKRHYFGPYGNHLKYGWLYYEITYQDVNSKSTETVVVYDYYRGIFIEATRTKPEDYWSNEIEKPCDRFFASEYFTYEMHKPTDEEIKDRRKYSDKIKYFELELDKSIIKSIRKLLSNDLYDYIIDNYKTSLAQLISMNTNTINDDETIEIDGKIWYNGFHNDINGIIRRGYLFYHYIPRGWRLPTSTELMDMLKKHPLLKKKISKYKELPVFRNNAGMECKLGGYMLEHKKDIIAMTLDDNDYRNEDSYFPCKMKCVNLLAGQITRSTASPSICNNGYVCNYVIMLVKMTDEEIAEQDNWADKILNKTFVYNTLEDIYKPFGIGNIDDISSIDFSVDIDGDIKNFSRNAVNSKLQQLKNAIAEYLGNNDIYGASFIDIKFKNDFGMDGSLEFRPDKDCDLRKFLTKISPLLCKDLCARNINDSDALIYKSKYEYDEDDSIYKIAKLYEKMGFISIDMYYYIKSALSLIGISHTNMKSVESGSGYYHKSYRHYSKTAYINEMKLTMKDGRVITVNGLSSDCFVKSKMYISEVSDLNNFSERIIKFKDEVEKALREKYDKD